MGISLKKIIIQNFKAFKEEQCIDMSDFSIFMGANSSGKSTALQALLILKQTIESNSPNIDLLLSGKYVTLGTYEDICNSEDKNVSIGISIKDDSASEECDEANEEYRIRWSFSENQEKNGHVKLVRIDLNNQECNMSMELQEDELYHISIDQKETKYAIKINNLLFREMYVLYDSGINEMFAEFLQDILDCLRTENTKNVRISKQEMVFQNSLDKFYSSLFKIYQKEESEIDELDDLSEEIKKSCVRNLLTLISEFSVAQLGDEVEFLFPSEVIENVLVELINTKEKMENINSIISKYRKLNRKEKIGELRKEVINDRIFIFKTVDKRKDKKSELDYMLLFRKKYIEVCKNIFGGIFYVGPLRESPQGLYNIGFESIPKYVGPTGAYFASVLLSEKTKRNFVLPDGTIESMRLSEALNEWVYYINVADTVSVEQSNSFGFNVHVSNTQQVSSDIMNVGIGTSQVLPVLITGLMAEKGETVIFEQPELHLHPFSQSRLADFFIAIAQNGCKVIVESHSEYLVLRIRYYIAAKKIDADMIRLNFFQNIGGTVVKQGNLTDAGFLEYPEDFVDETQKLLNDILAARFKKGLS